ncbi:MAG: FG-GAP-like repeat-containing protein, partial [bacterium]
MNKIKFITTLTYVFVFYSIGFSQALFTDSGQKLGEFSCWSVSLQDLDGDNDLDACIDGHFWINNGNGVFSKNGKFIGSNITVFDDLNGDNFIDAICDSNIFINDRNWNFVKQNQTFGKNVMGAYLLDLDNDNDLDAISYTENSDLIWYNDGLGHFTNSCKHLGGWSQCKYEASDVNGDGFIDIVVAIPHTPYPEMNSNINDKIWLGDGLGNFTEKVLPSVSFETRSIILKDFNGDGKLDLLMAKGHVISINWCKILFNDGLGNYTDSGQKLNLGYNSPDAKVKDLDGDGDLDIFFANGMPDDYGQPNTIWLNDGTGHFTDSGVRLGNINSAVVALGDIDNDNDIDALVANVNIRTNSSFTNVYLNTTTQSDVIENKEMEKSFRLNQNYPNPFNPSTNIKYSLSKPSQIKLSIYNMLGQKIKTLKNSFQNTGEYTFTW